jgi:hypothetical protein
MASHCLRHAVLQKRRVAGAADRIVDLYAIDLGLTMREPDSGVVSEDDRVCHAGTVVTSGGQRLRSVTDGSPVVLPPAPGFCR